MHVKIRKWRHNYCTVVPYFTSTRLCFKTVSNFRKEYVDLVLVLVLKKRQNSTFFQILLFSSTELKNSTYRTVPTYPYEHFIRVLINHSVKSWVCLIFPFCYQKNFEFLTRTNWVKIMRTFHHQKNIST